MSRKTFDFIITTENLLCTYRNYVFFGSLKRALVLLRILMELTLIVAHYTTYLLCFLQILTSNLIYFSLDSLTSFIYIVLPVLNSQKFECFLKIIDKNSQYIDDDIYIKNLAKKRIRVIVALVVCLFISVAVFASIRIINGTPAIGLDLYLFYIFQSTLLMGEMRHVTEYILFTWMINVIDEQLKCLIRSVNKQNPTCIVDNTIEQNEETSRRIEISEIDKWSNVYVNIKESSRISNSICSVQLCIMITTAILFYITVVYNMITQSLKGSRIPTTYAFLQFGKLVILVFLLYRLSRNAHQAQNHADTLRRHLCRKLVAPFHSESEYKAMRDLVRLVSTRPIRAQAFGAVDVNMTLLPVCLAVFTSYTVIALQFNNVI